MAAAPSSPEAQDARVFVVSYLEVAPESASVTKTQLQRFVSAMRKADGCLRAELFQRAEPENQFATVVIWKDGGAFEAGRDSEASKEFRNSIEPHLISGIDNRVHTAMAPDEKGSPQGNDSVCVVTHVDVPPPSKDTCIELLNGLVGNSRKEAGALRFEVFQQSDRPNHFSVVEIWKGRDAYSAHIVAEHTKTFRKNLSPISGALYDERLYSAVTVA